jgi:hypothetical protein
VIVHEVPWYPVAAYKKSLLILPIAMIVCIIIAFVVRETYPERDIRT